MAFRANGEWAPITCASCSPVAGIEYISKWDIVLTDSAGKDFVIPLGANSADASETAQMCRDEIKMGAKQARGWTDARIVPQDWPHYN